MSDYVPLVRNGAGFLMSFEGCDGSSKTTQSQLLYGRLLDELDIPVTLVREPGSTYNSEEIRNIVLTPRENKWEMVSELLLFQVARRELLAKVIVPELNAGNIVICDRFIDSTIAYQACGSGIPLKIVMAAIQIATEGILPDLTIVCDVPTEIGLERIRNKAPDRFESMDVGFFERARQSFLDLSARERCVMVDASGSIKEIHNTIYETFKNRYSKHVEGTVLQNSNQQFDCV